MNTWVDRGGGDLSHALFEDLQLLGELCALLLELSDEVQVAL